MSMCKIKVRYALFPLTFVLSLLYLFVVQLRNFFYDVGICRSYYLPSKVISVGNIVAGGTGKTPVVIAIVEYLKQMGFSPAILTRGYKSGLKSCDSVVYLDGKILLDTEFNYDNESIHADEALLQSNKLFGVPVIVGANRIKSLRRYIANTEQYPTHWILDDGFQHRRIIRDVNLLLLDSKEPFSNGYMLPCGMLREPLSSIKRASAVLFTRSSRDECDEEPKDYVRDKVKRFGITNTVDVPFVNSGLELVCGIAEEDVNFEIAKVLVACGIARPERFFEYLSSIYVNIKESVVVKDHALFDASVLQRKSKSCDLVITTEKDFYRESQIFESLGLPIYVNSVKSALNYEFLEKLLF